MGFLIGLLTVVMVLDCAALIFLVLIQLPKKDAGAGLAFGGGATDALFGAGSGNVLTKITKWAATIFFGLAVVLSLMQRVYHTRTTSIFEQKLQQGAAPQSIPAAPAQAPATPATAPQTPAAKPAAAAATNGLRIVTTPAEDTSLPAAAPTAPAPATPAKP
jgi:preprotein translocase subunit SecG